MTHSASSPTQTFRCLFGLNLGNHKETLIAARPAPSGLNHNETLIAARPARLWGLQMNHNKTLITARSARQWGLDTNHNETLIVPGTGAELCCGS